MCLERFLDAEQMALVDTSAKKENTVFDNFGDVIINAFVKVKVPDQRFLDMKDQISKFEQNLTGIEKMHSKFLKLDQGIPHI